jgi:hypothetical protein
MQIEVEVSDRIHDALARQADAHGVTIPAYLDRLVEDHIAELDRLARRKQAVAAMREFMKTNTATSGRGSMGWREYIHQGHKH